MGFGFEFGFGFGFGVGVGLALGLGFGLGEEYGGVEALVGAYGVPVDGVGVAALGAL